MSDKYESFSELADSEHRGVDYSLELADRGTDVMIMAPHGGGIEQGTSEIARAVAGEELSLYCFNGLKRRGNQALHITSTAFDEPAALTLAQRSQTVVAIHGLQEDKNAIYVGGLDETLRMALRDSLKRAGFHTVEGKGAHAGVSPLNPCNRGRAGKGVQLEITRGLRRTMFEGLDRRGRRIRKPPFYDLVGAVRSVLLHPVHKSGGP